MPTHLLDLPPELIEHVLALLSHQDAPSLSACRQTCRALNAAIAQSHLVRYIERTALLGVYDPFVSGATTTPDADLATATTTTMTIPERAAALEAWNEAWTTLDEIVCGQGQQGQGQGRGRGPREPNVRFAMPSRDELRSGRTAEVISGPSSAPIAPLPGSLSSRTGQGTDEVDGDEDEEDDAHCHFSFGPWFVAAAREGPGVRAGYSYLDVHAKLGADERGRGRGRGCTDGDQDGVVVEGCPQWTTINVPVRNVVVFALSTELDLAVAISCVLYHLFHFTHLNLTSPRNRARVEREEGGAGTITSRMEVRPLRFRDGTSHPCAEVPTIGLTVPGASAHNMAQTQVLGDYLLLWIGGPSEEDYSLCKLYLIAWKRGEVTQVSNIQSIHHLLYSLRDVCHSSSHCLTLCGTWIPLIKFFNSDLIILMTR